MVAGYAPGLEVGRRLQRAPGRPYAPYWQVGTARMWCGDARNLPLPSESVGLVVTSPPYNAKMRYHGYRDWLTWAEYWDGLIVPSLHEMYRVLVPGGRVCLNLANILRYKPEAEHKGPAKERGKPRPFDAPLWGTLTDTVIWPALTAAGFLPRERITWIKGDDTAELVAPSTAWGSWCSPSNPVIRAVAEPVFVASKGTYDRYSGVPSTLEPDRYMLLTRNVWAIPQEPHTSNPFPARFPVELARRCIELYSYRYDTVLDPYAGSGTVLVAAQELGRTPAGVEISEHAVRLARGRMRG